MDQPVHKDKLDNQVQLVLRVQLALTACKVLLDLEVRQEIQGKLEESVD